MTLTINGEQYKTVSIPDPHPEIAKKAWRLTSGGNVYDVYLDAVDNQVKCDCKDFIARRENKDRAGCKHCIALREAGLI